MAAVSNAPAQKPQPPLDKKIDKKKARRPCATTGCPEVFTPSRSDQLHHSDACRLRAFWQKRRRDYHPKRRKKPRKARSVRMCVGPARDAITSRIIDGSSKCGRWFVPVHRHNIYCEECRKLPPIKRRTRK